MVVYCRQKIGIRKFRFLHNYVNVKSYFIGNVPGSNKELEQLVRSE